MGVVPPKAPYAPVQITVFVKWAGFLLGSWIHHSGPKHIPHWYVLGKQLCSPLWSCCLLTWHFPPALGLALWMHLGRLRVSLKMCCRSRERHKWSLVNLQLFINLTLKSSVCCSLKKFSLVSSHPPCCLPLHVAQK